MKHHNNNNDTTVVAVVVVCLRAYRTTICRKRRNHVIAAGTTSRPYPHGLPTTRIVESRFVDKCYGEARVKITCLVFFRVGHCFKKRVKGKDFKFKNNDFTGFFFRHFLYKITQFGEKYF